MIDFRQLLLVKTAPTIFGEPALKEQKNPRLGDFFQCYYIKTPDSFWNDTTSFRGQA
jgi:hypothetical protein